MQINCVTSAFGVKAIVSVYITVASSERLKRKEDVARYVGLVVRLPVGIIMMIINQTFELRMLNFV
jgi:hypothetical protein